MSQTALHAGRLLLAIAGLATTALCHAQASGDPTRPPLVWLALQPKLPGAVAEAAPVTPGAQIVIVGPARKFAMVDGQAVRPGETYRGSKLLAVGDDGVTWQTEGQPQSTSMSPGVEKTDPAARRSTPSAAKTRAKTLNGGPQ
jgi:MSHA biogenesis protein MshK